MINRPNLALTFFSTKPYIHIIYIYIYTYTILSPLYINSYSKKQLKLPQLVKSQRLRNPKGHTGDQKSFRMKAREIASQTYKGDGPSRSPIILVVSVSWPGGTPKASLWIGLMDCLFSSHWNSKLVWGSPFMETSTWERRKQHESVFDGKNICSMIVGTMINECWELWYSVSVWKSCSTMHNYSNRFVGDLTDNRIFWGL